MSDIIVRSATPADAAAILALHVAVATRSGGLARFPDEITPAYVDGFVTKCLATGIILVAEKRDTGALAGEVHAIASPLRRLQHVMTSLTIAVHPDAQGLGVGRKLFDRLLGDVVDHWPHIARVELITAESNVRARRLYESVGFRVEGRFERGILDPATGLFETDLPMAWLRPSA